MLVDTSAFVEKQLAAGKTLQQVKDEGLPQRWKSWDQPLIPQARWIEILYRGLSPKQDTKQ
jgi:hypothetical protein